MSWVLSCRYSGGRISDQLVDVKFSERFAGDKIHLKDDAGEAVLDGVVLNSRELGRRHRKSLEQIVKEKAFDDGFPAMLRGPFSGFSAKGDRLAAWGNQTGDAPIFYYLGGEQFIVSNDFNKVMERLGGGTP